MEPGQPFVDNWHIAAIAEHLEAVTRGEIRNLLINMPPRHMKSLAVSVFWPAWEWATFPHVRWLYASYAEHLSIRDSLKTRQVIQSPWYQRRYGHMFRLRRDQNLKTKFENDRTGYRMATSVGGVGTGEGGNRVVVDDPHNINEAESDAVRQSTIDWWDQSMSTRLNNPKTDARVIVMQRVHHEDLSGHVLKQGGYEHLMLPAEYEGRKVATSIGWCDPREREGDLLWPERVGKAELDDLKLRLGTYGYVGQMQQRPSPKAGGMFKRHWWKRYRQRPNPADVLEVCTFWDTAFSEKSSADYTVGATWLRTATDCYVLEVFRDRLEFPALKREAKDVHARFAADYPDLAVPAVIEQKASGQSLIQELRRETGIPVIAFDVQGLGDKEARAHAATPFVEAGRVWLPEDAPWVDAFVEEHANFPLGGKDDQVDTTTMAIRRFSRPGGIALASADPGKRAEPEPEPNVSAEKQRTIRDLLAATGY